MRMVIRIKTGIFSLVTSLWLLTLFHSNMVIASTEELVYPPTSNPVDTPYKEWGMKFFQWWLSNPKTINPLTTSEHGISYECFIGVADHVVFLADPMVSLALGPPVTYNCTIPADRPILVLGITELCYYDEIRRTDASLQQCIHARNDYAQNDILIDGKRVENVDRFRFTTDFFNLTWPSNNIFEEPKQGNPFTTAKTLLDGWWVMLRPLPPGNHTIEVGVTQIIPPSLQDPGAESENLNLKLIYNLNVVNWKL
jgi:hypothetical protein